MIRQRCSRETITDPTFATPSPKTWSGGGWVGGLGRKIIVFRRAGELDGPLHACQP